MSQDQNTKGTEPDSGKGTEVPLKELLHQEADVPLFLRDRADGEKGDAQDEKDKTEE